MGKRRTNAPHKDRYDDSDGDESESECAPSGMEPEKLATIKARKKLIAKRRGPSEVSTLGAFGSLNKAGAGFPDSSKDIQSNSSVFSGFKGFSGFKAESLESTKSSSANSWQFSKSTIPSLTSTILPLPTTKPVDSIFPVVKPMFNSKNNGGHKINDEITSNNLINVKKVESMIENEIISNNISENELNFINELNIVYEKYYGNSKRVLKLPIEVLNQEMNNSEKQEDIRKKYGFLLAELNKHCSKWISKHVEEDPLIVLTPIFVDYFNYMLLMEKKFYPNTFKAKSPNGTSTLCSRPTSDSNSSISMPILSSNSSSNIVFNKKVDANHKNINGHQEDTEQKLSEFDQADKENEEAENDKIATTKNLTVINKNNQTNPMPLSFPNKTVLSSFSFKSPIDTLMSEKSSNSTTLAQFNTFKFGCATNDLTIKSNFDKKASNDESESNLKGSKAIEINKIAPSFKFGATTIADPSAIKTPEISISKESVDEKNKDDSPFSTAPAIFEISSADKPSLFKVNMTEATEKNSFCSTTSRIRSKEPEKTNLEQAKNLDDIPDFDFNNIKGSKNSISEFKNTETTERPGSSLFPPLPKTDSIENGKPVVASPFFSFAGSTSKTTNFGNLSNTGPTGSIFLATDNTFSFKTNTTNEQEEEEYVPPKPEVCDIKEEGAIYEKRTKLFYFNEKESKFVERGIGNLYIKTTNKDKASSLIIRADNKLANILLNVKLIKEFPISKISAKDISYICIPNPPIPSVDEKKPCKFLFKVKTEEDAIELLEKLNEYKK